MSKHDFVKSNTKEIEKEFIECLKYSPNLFTIDKDKKNEFYKIVKNNCKILLEWVNKDGVEKIICKYNSKLYILSIFYFKDYYSIDIYDHCGVILNDLSSFINKLDKTYGDLIIENVIKMLTFNKL